MAGSILKVAGPLVVAEGLEGGRMNDVVYVGELGLIGEIIELKGARAFIQVYEETAGLRPGEPVEGTALPLSVELGPGMIGSIYDGIQRPLDAIRERAGAFIDRGVSTAALGRERKWDFEPALTEGDTVSPGDLVGTIAETSLVTLRITVPPGVTGRVLSVHGGALTVEDTAAVVDTGRGGQALSLMERWPVRLPRPAGRRLPPREPLNTGQRVIDSFFPLAKGGTACIPGPFGSGKTIVQHQLAKWSDADIIVYIGCGERGNEMTDVLREFPLLRDPVSGESLMKRTVLIANTSNMPVAAREASVYTGITIAEYYRGMGLHVALMADSTSRWAEALREISGRQEEMPGDEGYPAYLASRIAEFYERAGRVETLGGGGEGTLSVIGAVSPPGGDLSDPVVQATLKVVKVFWGLDDNLAYRRHFPAINWLNSYSLYAATLGKFFTEEVAPGWEDTRSDALSVLQKESGILEVARLVGMESLSREDRLLLETARLIREEFLNQNAFDETDQYTSLKKQALMLRAIMDVHEASREALARGASFEDVTGLAERELVFGLKDVDEKEMAKIERPAGEVCAAIEKLAAPESGGEQDV